MKKIQLIATILLVAATGINITSTIHATHRMREMYRESKQIKEDVALLIYDIEEYGDVDTYTGSDHFERLCELTGTPIKKIKNTYK